MAAKPLPPRELVRQLLVYGPKTGLFTWLPRPREMFMDEGSWKAWNARFANTLAGTRSHHTNIIINHKGYRAHRLAWLLIYGEPIPDEIDHIDGDPYNNQIVNLRAATSAENKANSGKYKTNKSGVKGICFFDGKYSAQINYQGHHFNVGRFYSLKEATTAVRRARKLLHGKFARHE